jgi:uncharacterized protein YbaP (TraB family)
MFMKKFLKTLAPAALVASPVAAQEARPDLDPAVWVVKDADTTIYLFGTVHALDGKGDWLNDEVKSSFDQSSELVMEIITPEDQSALMPLLQKYAIDASGKTLTSKLSPEGQKLYAERLKAMGVPVTAFDSFRPFFAAMTLTVLDMQKLGIDAEQGAEKVLTKAAKAKGMKIGEVESVEQQFQMLGSLPEADQVKMLESTLKEQEKSKEIITKLLAAWGKGDHETVGQLMNDGEKDSKALYELLLVNRNKNWADWIDKRLDQPGTVFMAVGAGHLAGPDSVQKYLKDRGIKTDRVAQAGHAGHAGH